jgi:xanthine dehydrogenase accessory factor
MRELRNILAAFDALVTAAIPERVEAAAASAVLASVVRVEGSTYRRPGARMLVLPGDRMVGLLSGGCLEGDLLEHARAVRERGGARLIHYDHRGEDDLVWGLGLGCAGALDVLLERVDAGSPGPLPWLRRWVRERAKGALATGLEGPALGLRRALQAAGSPEGPLTGADDALREALASGRGGRLRLASGEAWLEVFHPPLRLTIFGAGPDAEPVARLAIELGWDVTVVDGRPAYARAERFPGARVVLAAPERAPAEAGIDAEGFVLVMTHHYLHDRDLLRHLLRAPARYVGVLGPRRRTEDLLEELRGEGIALDEGALGRLHAPAGLDLGTEAPEEIALALLAEIQAVANGRSGGWLRDRKGPIHDGGT